MARDVSGVYRANQFEEPVSSTGVRFTVISGNGKYITYRASDGGTLRVPNRHYSGDELVRMREMQQAYGTDAAAYHG